MEFAAAIRVVLSENFIVMRVYRITAKEEPLKP